jgi:hypothetical protein
LNCMMCHTFDYSIGIHRSTKSWKNFLSYSLERSINSKKNMLFMKHGPKLLNYVTHKNVLGNTTCKWEKN